MGSTLLSIMSYLHIYVSRMARTPPLRPMRRGNDHVIRTAESGAPHPPMEVPRCLCGPAEPCLVLRRRTWTCPRCLATPAEPYETVHDLPGQDCLAAPIDRAEPVPPSPDSTAVSCHA